MQMLCKGSRLQPKAGSQRISTTAQQQDLIKGKIFSGHEAQTITAQSIHSKAHNPCSILSCKQAHIRTSNLLCNNYYKQGPNNADPPPSKPTQATTKSPKHRKATAGSYELNQRYPTPSNSVESSNNARQASSKRSKTISKRSVSARGVQRYHSHFNRSCLPSAIEEDKILQQISTNSNDVAENYCRNWTRHPLLTAELLTNICSQRNNRTLTQLKLTQLTAESSSLIQNAVVPTNPNDDVPTNPHDDVKLLTAETR
ncbi:hypothetical protein F511_29683 [Dorcoceras hygrometricum]|uniref:Uncharacterized protein n=1 Tax=Dorcoceras hygrometricum TaxID=472368 RepID=A0A2Z7BJI8_9LAMI|nr:hypothetical protein F511_29683 [Dorcoceras hygrometricum]